MNMSKEKNNPRKEEIQAKRSKLDNAKNIPELKEALKEILGLK